MVQDLRFGARMLLKQSGFAAITVLTLGIGIGATSAVFSLIQGVLLTPPPYGRRSPSADSGRSHQRQTAG
jgi:putative ABC transport system permease protein